MQRKPYRTASVGTVAVWEDSISVADIRVSRICVEKLKSKSSGMLRRVDFMLRGEERNSVLQIGDLEMCGVGGVSGKGKTLFFIYF